MSLPISFFDTYQKRLVTLNPEDTIRPGIITIYRCGPTVYQYQHAGNAVGAFLTQLISDTARLSGWEIKHVENITDVGHLVGDGDHGEDKLEQGAKRDGVHVTEIVTKYFDDYKRQLSLLNIQLPEAEYNPKATSYIAEQYKLAIDLLTQKKAYLEVDGIYFDSQANAEIVQTINNLPGMPSSNGDRNFTGREINSAQRHPEDFALWKFVVPETLQKWKLNDFQDLAEYTNSKLEAKTVEALNQWGTPGWHSECVAMISQILGSKRFSMTDSTSNNEREFETDIHIGGEDHIPVHHRNEILQSEALGIHLSKHWLHNKFLMVDGKKMSKSLGNIFTVHGDPAETGFESITNKGYNPLSYRLMLFEHSYRDQINFTWEKLNQSQIRLYNLRKTAAIIRNMYPTQFKDDSENMPHNTIYHRLLELLRDDFNTPKFIESYSQLLNTCLADETYVPIARKLEKYLLKLDLFPQIPTDIRHLATERLKAKSDRDFERSDNLRNQIHSEGWMIDDHANSFSLWKK